MKDLYICVDEGAMREPLPPLCDIKFTNHKWWRPCCLSPFYKAMYQGRDVVLCDPDQIFPATTLLGQRFISMTHSYVSITVQPNGTRSIRYFAHQALETKINYKLLSNMSSLWCNS